jgi:hypothetical protein
MPHQRAHIGERDQIHDGRDCRRAAGEAGTSLGGATVLQAFTTEASFADRLC